MKLRNVLVTVLITFVLFNLFATVVYAKGQAQFEITRQDEQVKVGDSFILKVFVNPNNEELNTARLSLSYDKDLLQFENFKLDKAFPQVSPGNKGGDGIIYQGGFRVGDVVVKRSLFGIIVFRALAKGKGRVQILNDSKLIGGGQEKIRLDDLGELVINISNKDNRLNNLLQIKSETHPNNETWYARNDVTVSWQSENNIKELFYAFDELPKAVSSQEISNKKSSLTFDNVSDGLHYFHIKALFDDGQDELVDFPVRVDISKPNRLVPVVENKQILLGDNAVIRFGTTDQYSQISHYTVLLDGKDIGKQSSPLVIEAPSIGKHIVIVMAVDKAGNMIGGETTFSVLVPEKKIVSAGVSKGLIFSIIILILLIIGIFYKQYKKNVN